MNLKMRASAVLVWLLDGERADLDSFGPQLVYPPPTRNPGSWWCLEDAIVYANDANRDHQKIQWIKTGDVVLGPDQIRRAYSTLRVARKF
jgi:hypothetical protein